MRRIHTSHLHPGDIELDPVQARHLRDVLRLNEGTQVELFDDGGASAVATVVRCETSSVIVRVESVAMSSKAALELTIASAVPKGDRADWMIEKLSELGCDRFIPLATVRSVVLPEGKNKRERWMRIATESAKQSRRRGVMQIGDLASLEKAIEDVEGYARFFLSTDERAVPIMSAVEGHISPGGKLTMFIGPEGGWTDEEKAMFASRGCVGLKLTQTVLRVETAAIATATVVAVMSAAFNPA